MLQRAYRYVEQYAPNSLKTVIPEKWRIWFGHQIHVAFDPLYLKTKRPVPLPAGEDTHSLTDYLSRWTIEGEDNTEERVGYLRDALDRFLYTLALIPDEESKLLDVGAGPYFLTLLLRRFRPKITATLVNYFPGWANPSTQTLVAAGETPLVLPFANVDIEAERLPYPDNEFDVVLLCEVLEHFTMDPLHAILEIKRVLKPGGVLILTTPNVARFENIARMLGGSNLYDPYSGYGQHGRHNREYTFAELELLLTHAGFTIDQHFTSDVYLNHASRYFSANRLRWLVRKRKKDLGQYHFLRAVNRASASTKKPTWLYTNYPAEQLVEM